MVVMTIKTHACHSLSRRDNGSHDNKNACVHSLSRREKFVANLVPVELVL